MARTQTPTLIPLDRVAFVMGIDPYHFNSIYTKSRPMRANCDDAWYQYTWQTAGKVSREEMASALKQAEDMVTTYLGWSFLPRWFSEEKVLPRHYRTEINSLYGVNGQARSLQTGWGYVVEPGVRKSEFIETLATVFTDEDHDGYNETVTVTFSTNVVNKEDLRLYYPYKGGDDAWEIRPLSSISIEDGIATITFPKYMIVKDALLERVADPDDPHIAVDGDVESNFLDEVDAYRVYSDPSQQVLFYYDPMQGCHGPGCASDTSPGCLFIKDGRAGIVQYIPANWDGEKFINGTYKGQPVKARISYRAGWQDTRLKYPLWQQVDPNLERHIIFFASALLDRELCGCSNTRNIWKHQTVDMAMITEERSFVFPWDLSGNPFGTSRAGVQLWKYVHPLRLSQSSHKR